MRAADTPSGSSDPGAWVLPDALRPTFQRTYGPVLSGPQFEEAVRLLSVFATCGDRVTADVLALGCFPVLGVVDYRTQRNEPVDPSAFVGLALRRRVVVRNPPGTLTEELRSAVRELLRLGGGLIEVEGEEDLAVMALVESMPLESTVVYGVPGVGACFLRVDRAAKDRVESLLRQMVWRPTAEP